MASIVLPLISSEITHANGGGKAANLSALIRAKFQVPSGFVITTDAYRTFVAENHLQPGIEALVANLDVADIAGIEAASAEIRELFALAKMSRSLRQEIVQAYGARVASDEAVAVRSSATAEDLPRASFAGQQESFLNVVGERGLLDAVLRCWSSLWTARALAYRLRQGIPHHEVSMAVVVQTMVPARISGVLFTVNPVTGRRNQMLINAVWGVGSILVEGKITPDTFIADRETGEILETTVAEKPVMLEINKDGLLREAPVDLGQRRTACLSELHVSALVSTGKRIEALFGRPQDVEWAIRHGRLYILQSRPITAASDFGAFSVPGDDGWPPLATKPSRPYDLWTQSDLGERWPDPITPLTWSTWKPITEENMRNSFAGLGEPWLEEIEWVKRAYGRAYLNEGALAHVLHRGYGMPATSFADGMGSVPELMERYRGWKWGTVLRRAPLLLKMNRTWGALMDRFEQEFPTIEAWVDEFMGRSLDDLDDRALWREARDTWHSRLMTYIEYHSAATSLSLNAYSRLESNLKGVAEDDNPVPLLVTGITGIVQAEIAPSLWALAEEARTAGIDPILTEQPPGPALVALGRDPRAEPFLKQLRRFLRRHGHRCITEAEWLYPRWVEAPEQVIEQIAVYLRSGQQMDPGATAERQRMQREEATRRIEALLNPMRRAAFHRDLERLQHLVRMRDNGQHYLVKLVLPQRRIYATLGKRWAARGWLADGSDFFFLALEEIAAVVDAAGPEAAGLDLVRLARQRRLAWQHWMEQVSFPSVLDADGEPLLDLKDGDDGSYLSGIPASGGQVTGRARVILSPTQASDLQPGEILVTRATDPGWTPVFSLIGGLVLEVGGQLSHGAIVAREYGLPAVVNVATAVASITDGQTITVDGTSGRIYLAEESEPAAEAGP